MTEAESLEIYETARRKHEPAFIESGDVAAYKAAVDPLWDEHLKRTGQQVNTAPAAVEDEDDSQDGLTIPDYLADHVSETVERDLREALDLKEAPKPTPKARAKKATPAK